MNLKKNFAVFMCFILASSQTIAAGSCVKTASVCVDTTASKRVSGIDINISEVGGCWEYEDSYDCSGDGEYDYCGAIAKTPNCHKLSNVKQADGSELSTYRCGPLTGSPQGVIKLENSYTLVYDHTSTAACATPADNPTCQLSAKVCTAGTPESCSAWQEHYNCIANSTVDYCSALKQSGCTLVSSHCAENTTTGVCSVNDNDFRCTANPSAPATGTQILDGSYTVVKAGSTAPACSTAADNPRCNIAKQTCTEGAGTRVIGGVPVYKDCWNWVREYTCAGGGASSSCDYLQSNPNCTQTGSSCLHTLADGTCDTQNLEFKCVTSPAISSTSTDCGTVSFCVDGDCFDTSSPPDTDFGKVIAFREMIREVGALELFKGEASFCRDGLITDCCKTKSGGGRGRNDILMNEAGKSVLQFGATSIITYGSPYIYSGLMENGMSQLANMFSSAVGASTVAGAGSYTFSFGGISVSYMTEAALQNAIQHAAQQAISDAIAHGAGETAAQMAGQAAAQAATEQLSAGFSVGICVPCLVVMVLMIIYQILSTCNNEEVNLGMKREQGLCHKVGKWCSQEYPWGGCYEEKEGWCCFPSKLARIIQEQGRAYLGKSWGSPKHPDCGSFTLEELASLPFDQFDLSEFINDIIPTNSTSEFYNQAVERLKETNPTMMNYYNE